MKIGVNARLLNSNKHSGVQNYITLLYREVNKSKAVSIIQFIPRFSQSIVYAVIFDLILVSFKSHNVDVFHAAGGVIPLLKLSAYTIVTIHDVSFKVFPKLSSDLDVIYRTFTTWFALRKSDKIIVHSKAIKTLLLQMYSIESHKIAVVPLASDSYFIKKDTLTYYKQMQRKYNPKKSKLILSVGGHSDRKNIITLLKMISTNKAYFTNIKVIITMAKNQKKYLQFCSANGINNILLLSYIQKRELRALYFLSDIYINTSIHEGFGLPILEAMSAGSKCVLASDIPVFREIISDSKYLFNPYSTTDIFTKIKTYIYKSSQNANRKNIIVKF